MTILVTGAADSIGFHVSRLLLARNTPVIDILACLESPPLPQVTGITAEKTLPPMQPSDTEKTFADLSSIRSGLRFQPSTTIDRGLPEFVKWHKACRGL